MQILILGFAKIKYMPYMNFYLDSIDEGHDIEVVYWNRDGKAEDLSRYQEKGISFHEFAEYQEDDVSPASKIGSFAKYRKFAKGILKSREYDLVICLHTFPGLLVSDILRRKYRGRYIFDYRDHTYENNS